LSRTLAQLSVAPKFRYGGSRVRQPDGLVLWRVELRMVTAAHSR
jgi:hypothetical protein